MRNYEKFDLSFSPICKYSSIFSQIQKSFGLSVFGFDLFDICQISIWSLSNIWEIQTHIQTSNSKVK